MAVELRALVFSTRRYNDIRVVACITLTVFYVCTIMASTRNMYIRHRIQANVYTHIYEGSLVSQYIAVVPIHTNSVRIRSVVASHAL